MSDLLERIGNIQKFFDDKNNSDLLDSGIRSGISSEASSISDKYSDIMKEDSALKLGIVGRVKAGKSSFLNALLFDGRDVLPKAATPMTAALTKINYSETGKNEAKVVFYSVSEWEKIEGLARECEQIFQAAFDQMQQEQESITANVRAGVRNVYANINRRKNPDDSVTPPREKKLHI
ncbi:MAG: dynamin family protein [Synergistaceae bacterium]|nr:dynamin family protein [Synergistaceae bacterium]